MSLTEQELQTFNELLLKIDKKERKALINDTLYKHDLELYQKYATEFFRDVNVIRILPGGGYYPLSFYFHSCYDLNVKNISYFTIQKSKYDVVSSEDEHYLDYTFDVVDTDTLKTYQFKNKLLIACNSSDQKAFNNALYKMFAMRATLFVRQKGRKKKATL